MGESYRFAWVVRAGRPGSPFAPELDSIGRVAWQARDGFVQLLHATALSVAQERHERPLLGLCEVEETQIDVYVTRARLVIVCERFLKQDVRYPLESRRIPGAFLAGQLWWPWLWGLGYIEKTRTLRLMAQDDRARWIAIDITLSRPQSARAEAQRVLAMAAAMRRELARVELPEDPRFGMIRLPGARQAVDAAPAGPSPLLLDPGSGMAVA